MFDWLKRWRTARTLERRAIPDALWRLTLTRFPFLALPTESDATRLREMVTLFLAEKEFTGAQGLDINDDMAVSGLRASAASGSCRSRLIGCVSWGGSRPRP